MVSSGNSSPQLGCAGSPSPVLTAADTRLIEYHYLSTKTLKYIREIKDLLKNRGDKTPAARFVTLQCGTVFNVNEALVRRSELLLNGTKFNAAQSVEPDVALVPVPLDAPDGALVPYDRPGTRLLLPQQRANVATLKLLELLLINTYEIYKARINAALAKRPLELDLDWPRIEIAPEFGELQAIHSVFFGTPGPDAATSQDGIRDFTRTNEFHFLDAMLSRFTPELDRCRQELEKLREFRTQEQILASPDSPFLMHRGMMTLIRLADLYATLRRVGRQVYINHSPWLSQYARSGDEFLRRALQRCEQMFVQPKQNKLLLSLISRYSNRQGKFPLRPEPLVEFFRVGVSTSTLLAKMVDSLSCVLVEYKKIVAAGRQNEFDRELVRERVRRRAFERRKSLVGSPGHGTATAHPPPPPPPESTKEGVRDYLERERKDRERRAKMQNDIVRAAKTSAQTSAQTSQQSSPEVSRSSSLREKRKPPPGPPAVPTRPTLATQTPDQSQLPSQESSQQPLHSTSSDSVAKGVASMRISETPEPFPDNQKTTERIPGDVSPLNSSSSASLSPSPSAVALTAADVSADAASTAATTAVTASASASSSVTLAPHVLATPSPPRSRSSSVSSNNSMSSPSMRRGRNAPPIRSPLAPQQGNGGSSGGSAGALAAAATAASGTKVLSAQQRFQQQMKKAAQNGSIYSRQLEARSYTRPRSSSNASNMSNASAASYSSVPSVSPSRSRASTISTAVEGNLTVVESADEGLYDTDGNIIRRVRFTGVPEYREEEDAPTPMAMHKQLRQKFTLYRKQFETRQKAQNSQEGMAFRTFRDMNDEAEVDNLRQRRFMDSVKNEGRFTRLFKRR